MRIGSKTDKGRIREQNEDAYGFKENLFVVADGMGGHQAGEIASAIAVETILAANFTNEIELELGQAIQKANDSILAEVDQHPDLSGMGTTVAVLLVQAERIYLAHVGDSRIYRFDTAGRLGQLTQDHSLVAELVKSGEISENEAKHHPQRNILTQALGSKGEIKIEFQTLARNPGDKFLLCSDGLSGMVDEASLAAILKLEQEPQFLAERLVSFANDQGGLDNITVIVVEL
jgi:serine/threonine protein phosphatase PrpC